MTHLISTKAEIVHIELACHAIKTKVNDRLVSLGVKMPASGFSTNLNAILLNLFCLTPFNVFSVVRPLSPSSSLNIAPKFQGSLSHRESESARAPLHAGHME